MCVSIFCLALFVVYGSSKNKGVNSTQGKWKKQLKISDRREKFGNYIERKNIWEMAVPKRMIGWNQEANALNNV